MERAFFHSIFSHLSLHTAANLYPGCGAAGVLTSSDTTHPTCSFGQPQSRGLWGVLYVHSQGLSTYINKSYFVWCCLCKALTSFVFSLFSSQRRRFYPISFHAVALSYYILFTSLCSFLPYEAFKSTSIPPCQAFLFLLWSIMALTCLLMSFKWKYHAVRLINTNNII